MENREDRLALMRRENETGPTAGKNQLPGKIATALNTARSGKTSGKIPGKCGIAQGELQKIPIINTAVARIRDV